MLFGDCTGNWQPSGAGAAAIRAEPPDPMAVTLGRAQAAGRRLRVPLRVDASEGFVSLDAEVTYDPARLVLRGVRRAGGARGALLQAHERTPGVLAVALASAQSLSGGVVLTLQFETRDSRHAPIVRVAAASVNRRE